MSDTYATRNLPPAPPTSMSTIPMADNLLVDIYGLEELPPSVSITCVWLLHPRTRTRARMRDIACRVIAAYNSTTTSTTTNSTEERTGLVALAFDMPFHGSRMGDDEKVHRTWAQGNENHAVDMMKMIGGARMEVSRLMDEVSVVLGREVGGHLVLGWSLGGHAAWEAWMGEDRVDGAVVVVGCPDFMGLMADRADTSNLNCPSPFLTSHFFPPTLIQTCINQDPKAILFSTDPLPSLSLADKDRERISSVLERRHLRDKPLLLLSGGADKLVPYVHTERFVKVVQEVGGGSLDIKDLVFDGVGHAFCAEMVEEAVGFLVEKAGQVGSKNKAKI